MHKWDELPIAQQLVSAKSPRMAVSPTWVCLLATDAEYARQIDIISLPVLQGNHLKFIPLE
jgi:hypothetical protein